MPKDRKPAGTYPESSVNVSFEEKVAELTG